MNIKIGGLILTIAFLVSTIGAQTGGLPRFGKNESYTKVRIKMLKVGWKPFHAKNSDQCQSGDARCAGRPEMHVCAGTGLGNCEFYWKRGGKLLAIYTVGEENAVYSGHKFLK
ncbi:MAG: hypothetical protein M3T96_09020 [Acidobacteriota bacterium]|nr:hypothetical protein [Acidobacteriota bacterium]